MAAHTGGGEGEGGEGGVEGSPRTARTASKMLLTAGLLLTPPPCQSLAQEFQLSTASSISRKKVFNSNSTAYYNSTARIQSDSNSTRLPAR